MNNLLIVAMVAIVACTAMIMTLSNTNSDADISLKGNTASLVGQAGLTPNYPAMCRGDFDCGKPSIIETYCSDDNTQINIRNTPTCVKNGRNRPYCDYDVSVSEQVTCGENAGCIENMCRTTAPIFTTSIGYRGNFGKYGSNQICQTSAINSGREGTWISILSTDEKNVWELFEGYRLQDSQFVTVQDEIIATGMDNLLDGQDTELENSISYNEFGTPIMDNPWYVWTGTNSQGELSEYYCDNWESGNAGFLGTIGSVMSTAQEWIELDYMAYCIGENRLYCVKTTHETECLTGEDCGFEGELISCHDEDSLLVEYVDYGCEHGGETDASCYYEEYEEEIIDCIDEEFCHEDECVECVTDDDCSEGETCEVGECVVPVDEAVIFVTSEEFVGDIGGREGADDICTDAASNADLDGEWIALLSSSDISAMDLLLVNGLESATFYNSNGDEMAASLADLFDGMLQNPVGYDEFGEERTVGVWTGTTSQGESSGNNCDDWQNAEMYGPDGTYGSSNADNGFWMSVSSSTCFYFYERGVYCIKISG